MASEQPKGDSAAPPSQATEQTTQPAQPTTQPQTQKETTFIHEDPSTAPDPDEDDLSDLDDVLDEFAATNISSKPAPSSSGPGRPSTSTHDAASAGATNTGGLGVAEGGAGPGGLFASEDEFAKAMQEGMKELLGEFESNPDMAKQFEDLVKELGEGMGAVAGETGVGAKPGTEGVGGDGIPAVSSFEGAGAATSTSTKAAETPSAVPKATSKATPAATASFEDTIRATMERMNASSASATSASQKSAANPEEDFLAAMLREMESSGAGGGAGLGSDEDFSKMLMGMMEQLTNKEILYEPMKELHDKFPAWMKENEGKVKKEDWERYVEQKRLVGEIVGKFEEEGYADGKVEYREFIVERMQQVRFGDFRFLCAL